MAYDVGPGGAPSEKPLGSQLCVSTALRCFLQGWVVVSFGADPKSNYQTQRGRRSCVCVYTESLRLCPMLCDPVDLSHRAPLSMVFSWEE